MAVGTGSIIALAALVSVAQAAVPRATAGDYPAHADSGAGAIAAEYLVHSVPTEQQMLVAGSYLVIEVGVFPKKAQDTVLSNVQFHLVINGKPLHEADTPGTVAASLKYSDWEPRRGLQSGAQVGPVVLGPQQPAGRFPGDPSARQPVPQSAPPDDPTGMAPQQLTVDELIAHAALPEGTFGKPVGGCLFFRYDGKTKKIRTVELVWEPPGSAPVTLRLMPVQ